MQIPALDHNPVVPSANPQEDAGIQDYEHPEEIVPSSQSSSPQSAQSPQKSASSNPMGQAVEMLRDAEDDFSQALNDLTGSTWWEETEDGYWILKVDIAAALARLQQLMMLIQFILMVIDAYANMVDITCQVILGDTSRASDAAGNLAKNKMEYTSDMLNKQFSVVMDTINNHNSAIYQNQVTEIENKEKQNFLLVILGGLTFNSTVAENERTARVKKAQEKVDARYAEIQKANLASALEFVRVLANQRRSEYARTDDPALRAILEREIETLDRINPDDLITDIGSNGYGLNYKDLNKKIMAAIMIAMNKIAMMRSMYLMAIKAQREMMKVTIEALMKIKVKRNIWKTIESIANEMNSYAQASFNIVANRLNSYISAYNQYVSTNREKNKYNALFTGNLIFMPLGLTDWIVLELFVPDQDPKPSQTNIEEINQVLISWGFGGLDMSDDSYLGRLEREEIELLNQLDYSSNTIHDMGNGYEGLEYGNISRILQKLSRIAMLREAYFMVLSARRDMMNNTTYMLTGAEASSNIKTAMSAGRLKTDLASQLSTLKLDTLDKMIRENNKRRKEQVEKGRALSNFIGSIAGVILAVAFVAILVAIGPASSIFISLALTGVSSLINIAQSVASAIFTAINMPEEQPYEVTDWSEFLSIMDDYDSAYQEVIRSLLYDESLYFTREDGSDNRQIRPDILLDASQRLTNIYYQEMGRLMYLSAKENMYSILIQFLGGIGATNSMQSSIYMAQNRFNTYCDILDNRISMMLDNIRNHNSYIAAQEEIKEQIINIVVSVISMILGIAGAATKGTLSKVLKMIDLLINYGKGIYDLIQSIDDSLNDTGDLEEARRALELWIDNQISNLNEDDPYYNLRRAELEALRGMDVSRMLISIGNGYVCTNYHAIAEMRHIVTHIYNAWDLLATAREYNRDMLSNAIGVSFGSNVLSEATNAAREAADGRISRISDFWKGYSERLNEINKAKRALTEAIVSFLLNTVFTIDNAMKIIDKKSYGIFGKGYTKWARKHEFQDAIIRSLINGVIPLILGELVNWIFLSPPRDDYSVVPARVPESTGNARHDGLNMLEYYSLQAAREEAYSNIFAEDVNWRNTVRDLFANKVNSIISNTVKEGIKGYITQKDREKQEAKAKKGGLFKKIIGIVVKVIATIAKFIPVYGWIVSLVIQVAYSLATGGGIQGALMAVAGQAVGAGLGAAFEAASEAISGATQMTGEVATGMADNLDALANEMQQVLDQLPADSLQAAELSTQIGELREMATQARELGNQAGSDALSDTATDELGSIAENASQTLASIGETFAKNAIEITSQMESAFGAVMESIDKIASATQSAFDKVFNATLSPFQNLSLDQISQHGMGLTGYALDLLIREIAKEAVKELMAQMKIKGPLANALGFLIQSQTDLMLQAAIANGGIYGNPADYTYEAIAEQAMQNFTDSLKKGAVDFIVAQMKIKNKIMQDLAVYLVSNGLAQGVNLMKGYDLPKDFAKDFLVGAVKTLVDSAINNAIQKALEKVEQNSFTSALMGAAQGGLGQFIGSITNELFKVTLGGVEDSSKYLVSYNISPATSMKEEQQRIREMAERLESIGISPSNAGVSSRDVKDLFSMVKIFDLLKEYSKNEAPYTIISGAVAPVDMAEIEALYPQAASLLKDPAWQRTLVDRIEDGKVYFKSNIEDLVAHMPFARMAQSDDAAKVLAAQFNKLATQATNFVETSTNTICISPRVIDGIKAGDPNASMTLAHEISHMILDLVNNPAIGKEAEDLANKMAKAILGEPTHRKDPHRDIIRNILSGKATVAEDIHFKDSRVTFEHAHDIAVSVGKDSPAEIAYSISQMPTSEVLASLVVAKSTVAADKFNDIITEYAKLMAVSEKTLQSDVSAVRDALISQVTGMKNPTETLQKIVSAINAAIMSQSSETAKNVVLFQGLPFQTPSTDASSVANMSAKAVPSEIKSVLNEKELIRALSFTESVNSGKPVSNREQAAVILSAAIKEKMSIIASSAESRPKDLPIILSETASPLKQLSRIMILDNSKAKENDKLISDISSAKAKPEQIIIVLSAIKESAAKQGMAPQIAESISKSMDSAINTMNYVISKDSASKTAEKIMDMLSSPATRPESAANVVLSDPRSAISVLRSIKNIANAEIKSEQSMDSQKLLSLVTTLNLVRDKSSDFVANLEAKAVINSVMQNVSSRSRDMSAENNLKELLNALSAVEASNRDMVNRTIDLVPTEVSRSAIAGSQRSDAVPKTMGVAVDLNHAEVSETNTSAPVIVFMPKQSAATESATNKPQSVQATVSAVEAETRTAVPAAAQVVSPRETAPVITMQTEQPAKETPSRLRNIEPTRSKEPSGHAAAAANNKHHESQYAQAKVNPENESSMVKDDGKIALKVDNTENAKIKSSEERIKEREKNMESSPIGGAGGGSQGAQAAAASAAPLKKEETSGISTSYRSNLTPVPEMFSESEILEIDAEMKEAPVSKNKKEDLELLNMAIGIKNRSKNAEQTSGKAQDPARELESLKKPIEQMLAKIYSKLEGQGRESLKALAEDVKSVDFSKTEQVMRVVSGLNDLISTSRIDAKTKKIIAEKMLLAREHIENTQNNVNSFISAQKLLAMLLKGESAKEIAEQIVSKPNTAAKVINMITILMDRESKTRAEHIKELADTLNIVEASLVNPRVSKAVTEARTEISQIINKAAAVIEKSAVPEQIKQQAYSRLNDIHSLLSEDVIVGSIEKSLSSDSSIKAAVKNGTFKLDVFDAQPHTVKEKAIRDIPGSVESDGSMSLEDLKRIVKVLSNIADRDQRLSPVVSEAFDGINEILAKVEDQINRMPISEEKKQTALNNAGDIKNHIKKAQIESAQDNAVFSGGMGGMTEIASAQPPAEFKDKAGGSSGSSSYYSKIQSDGIFSKEESLVIMEEMNRMGISKISDENAEIISLVIGIKNKARSAESLSKNILEPDKALSSMQKPLERIFCNLLKCASSGNVQPITTLSDKIGKMDFSSIENVVQLMEEAEVAIDKSRLNPGVKEIVGNKMGEALAHLISTKENMHAKAYAQRIVDSVINMENLEDIVSNVLSKRNIANKVIDMMASMANADSRLTAKSLEHLADVYNGIGNRDENSKVFRSLAAAKDKAIKLTNASIKSVKNADIPNEVRLDALAKLDLIMSKLEQGGSLPGNECSENAISASVLCIKDAVKKGTFKLDVFEAQPHTVKEKAIRDIPGSIESDGSMSLEDLKRIVKVLSNIPDRDQRLSPVVNEAFSGINEILVKVEDQINRMPAADEQKRSALHNINMISSDIQRISANYKTSKDMFVSSDPYPAADVSKDQDLIELAIKIRSQTAKALDMSANGKDGLEAVFMETEKLFKGFINKLKARTGYSSDIKPVPGDDKSSVDSEYIISALKSLNDMLSRSHVSVAGKKTIVMHINAGVINMEEADLNIKILLLAEKCISRLRESESAYKQIAVEITSNPFIAEKVFSSILSIARRKNDKMAYQKYLSLMDEAIMLSTSSALRSKIKKMRDAFSKEQERQNGKKRFGDMVAGPMYSLSIEMADPGNILGNETYDTAEKALESIIDNRMNPSQVAAFISNFDPLVVAEILRAIEDKDAADIAKELANSSKDTYKLLSLVERNEVGEKLGAVLDMLRGQHSNIDSLVSAS